MLFCQFKQGYRSAAWNIKFEFEGSGGRFSYDASKQNHQKEENSQVLPNDARRLDWAVSFNVTPENCEG